MISDLLPPGVLLILGGALLPFVRGPLRAAVLLVAPLLTLAAVWTVPDGVVMTAGFLDYTLQVVEGDRLSRLFGIVFALAAFGGGLFALRQDFTRELAAAYVYAGSSIGVVFSGDLITLFVFWEIMAIASTVVVWSGNSARSARAGMRYILVHLLGGVLLMAGLAAHIVDTGSIDATRLLPSTLGSWLMLAGILVNAGAPPLWAWVADAYPEASWSGAVFLSAFTTKTAVYVLIRLYPGTEILVWIGLAMIFYGVIYALRENDMRRILVYSIVNQVGFMVTAVGIGTETALNGAAAHAFAHILYKAVLLMSAGAVLYQTGGVGKCTQLGGLARSMPFTTAAAIIGALSICAFPLTSGFVSKSMIIDAAGAEHMAAAWFLLEAASAAAILYVGLRFVWFVFFDRDSGLRPADPPLSMKAAMGLMAALCLILGVWPQPLYDLLPYPVDYVPYTVSHVVHQLQLLLFAAAVFFLTLPLTRPREGITLDFDWFYRRFGLMLARELGIATGRAGQSLLGSGKAVLRRFVGFVETHHGPGGLLARTWGTSMAVLSVLVLLLVYLLIYYV
ncbi:Na(+)/H(+) antiporter subunit D [Caenispirillum bisanense]|uniref:Na(+)/H(+) antiporter subunit D n=1 Tax=Caenispirillum bisanense TaxID=414052 RepID=UPI0031DA7573